MNAVLVNDDSYISEWWIKFYGRLMMNAVIMNDKCYVSDDANWMLW